MAIIIITVLLALTFDFINGFHDTANAIATCVSTKALALKYAIIMAAIMNFIGAIVSTGVAKSIASKIVNLDVVPNADVIMVAALISAILWNLFTWYFGIPSSSSHALIGSLAGAGIADAGIHAVKASGFIEILIALILSPVLAITVGFLMYKVLKLIFQKANLGRANKGFRRLQILTAALQAFEHGMNDAQKSMGIITMALIAYGAQKTFEIPLWVQVSCALSMALGTSVGGWRIIKTVGTQIMKLKPVSAVAADLSSAIVIQTATAIGLPVSTTHVISSSIMGVGASSRVKGVKWSTGKKMVTAWVITIPITIILSAGIFEVLNIFI